MGSGFFVSIHSLGIYFTSATISREPDMKAPQITYKEWERISPWPKEIKCNHLLSSRGKVKNRHEMANEHIERCSTELVMEMQIKTTIKYHFAFTRIFQKQGK